MFGYKVVIFIILLVQLFAIPLPKDAKLLSVSVFSNLGVDPGPQKGYSTDKQQVSPFKCYDMSVTNVTNVKSVLKFDKSESYS